MGLADSAVSGVCTAPAPPGLPAVVLNPLQDVQDVPYPDLVSPHIVAAYARRVRDREDALAMLLFGIHR